MHIFICKQKEKLKQSGRTSCCAVKKLLNNCLGLDRIHVPNVILSNQICELYEKLNIVEYFNI